MDNKTGRRFGMLIALEYVGNGKWRCMCDCGNETVVLASNLTQLHTKSCGCLKEKPLDGQRCGKLLIIRRSKNKMRGSQARVVYLCKCDCGNEVEVYSDLLANGLTRSCGCLPVGKKVENYTRIDNVSGTQISKIAEIKPTLSNKSGVVGVNWDKSRGLWQASIRFQGKKYNLGRFVNIEDAISARKEAELKYFGEFLKERGLEFKQ